VNANCKVQIEKCKFEETYSHSHFDFCILKFLFCKPFSVSFVSFVCFVVIIIFNGSAAATMKIMK